MFRFITISLFFILNISLNVVGQNQFDYLIYKYDSICNFLNLEGIDSSLLNKSTSDNFTKNELSLFKEFVDLNNSFYNSTSDSITYEIVDWQEKGKRIIYQSDNSEFIINKYLDLITLFKREVGIKNMTRYSYTLHKSEEIPNCKPTKCRQDIGLGQSWTMDDGGYITLSIYITTEFDKLTIFMDYLKEKD